MTIQLKAEDFRQLTDLLQTLPDFANPRDRRRLVAAALAGKPLGQRILAKLDLEGDPLGRAVQVVSQLSKFGQVEAGEEALGVFLNYVQTQCGVEQGQFIADLLSSYPFFTSGSNHSQRTDTASPKPTAEKIWGENTLKDVRVLQLAQQAAKAVVRVNLNHKGIGTGFMVAPKLLMTARHVIRSEEQAEQASFWFDYELDPSGIPLQVKTAKAAEDGLFHTNPLTEMDYTILELADPPDFGQPLQLRPVVPATGDRVNIIQHPKADHKKISLQDNKVSYADRRTIQYMTATDEGSSGSPVFNEEYEVIAIHTEGGCLTEPGTGKQNNRNAGTSMVAVLEDLKANAPAIYACIKQSATAPMPEPQVPQKPTAEAVGGGEDTAGGGNQGKANNIGIQFNGPVTANTIVNGDKITHHYHGNKAGEEGS